MTPAENLMQLVDTYADAECDYRMSGRATSCQEEYASDLARAELVAAKLSSTAAVKVTTPKITMGGASTAMPAAASMARMARTESPR